MKLFTGLGGVFTGLTGAVIEAWAQLRIGKLRVLLSLVGVAVAVAAMSFVIAVGQVSVSAVNAVMEQYSGRPGTVTISVSPTWRGVSKPDDDAGSDDSGGAGGSGGQAGGGGQAGTEGQAGGGGQAAAGSAGGAAASSDTSIRISEAMSAFVDRYEIGVWATTYDTSIRFAFPDGPRQVRTQAVSTGYGLLHHTQVTQGRWLRSDDADDMSPSLVVSQGFLDAMGVETLTGPLTVTSYEPTRTTYTIVGVLEPEDLSYCTTTDAEGNTVPCPQSLSAFVLNSSYEQQLPVHAVRPAPSLEVWTGTTGASEIKQRAKDNLDAQFGQGSTQVTDNLQSANANLSTGAFTTVVSGAGVFVMVLGALGLVNISLVTVRQRIHEIGVRRSFGATSRRIFFSIMLESVVATIVAGIVGVGIAVVALRVVPLGAILSDIPVPDNPPFPMSAALIGLVAASGVGALAGIIPAIVAVRIRPIDAIRF